jgi:hypothetical protein
MTKDALEKARLLSDFNKVDNDSAQRLAEKATITMNGTVFQKNVSAFIDQEIKAMNERYVAELSKI